MNIFWCYWRPIRRWLNNADPAGVTRWQRLRYRLSCWYWAVGYDRERVISSVHLGLIWIAWWNEKPSEGPRVLWGWCVD